MADKNVKGGGGSNNGSKKVKFKAPAFELEPDAEVCEVLSTEEKNHYQFVIRDEDKRIVIICTWDIESECEVSMVQFPI